MIKKTALLLLLTAINFFNPTGVNSQVEDLVENCMSNISSPFIRGDRSMKAFLTAGEVAEFRTTFFAGNIYRIVSCSFEQGLIELTLLDANRNPLFNTRDHGNPRYWDFKIEGSMEGIIEARLNSEVAESGMVMLLVGFASSEVQGQS